MSNFRKYGMFDSKIWMVDSPLSNSTKILWCCPRSFSGLCSLVLSIPNLNSLKIKDILDFNSKVSLKFEFNSIIISWQTWDSRTRLNFPARLLRSILRALVSNVVILLCVLSHEKSKQDGSRFKNQDQNSDRPDQNSKIIRSDMWI